MSSISCRLLVERGFDEVIRSSETELVEQVQVGENQVVEGLVFAWYHELRRHGEWCTQATPATAQGTERRAGTWKPKMPRQWQPARPLLLRGLLACFVNRRVHEVGLRM